MRFAFEEQDMEVRGRLNRSSLFKGKRGGGPVVVLHPSCGLEEC